MDTTSKFVQFGEYRIPVDIIQSYRVISKQQKNYVTRYVNINPDSPEGKKLLKEYQKKSTSKAIGAGIAAGTAGAVALGGAAVAVTGIGAILLVATPIGLAVTGATAVGSAVAGVVSSKNKSKKKERNIYSKEVKDIDVVDKVVLEITLKKNNIFKKRIMTISSNNNAEILKKCEELDEMFGVSQKTE